MQFTHQHILSVNQFTQEGVEHLFQFAHRMRPIEQHIVRCQVLDGYILGSFFFEASTRTRMSFETAFMRLGGLVNTTTGFTFSSMAKGESLEDTIRVAQGYCDIIVMRHPDVGSAELASRHSTKPVINGGDGPGEHPTQALLDLFTIREEKKRIEGITIAMIGDLKHGRTVHSLTKLLTLYRGITIQLIAPEEVQMQKELIAYLRENGCEVMQSEHLEDCLPTADILYVTRIQKERFSDTEAYDRVNGTYSIDRALIEKYCKSDITIMHPLPRLGELACDIDDHPGAAYFRQAENGTLVRMALFILVLGKEKKFV